MPGKANIIKPMSTTIRNSLTLAGEEHWLGLENMHTLTAGKKYALRVRLTDANGVKGVGYYTTFRNAPHHCILQSHKFNI